MSGRDVPTQEKALSVALSVIMVLSVVAIGMAGFAGSAAAQSIDGDIAGGSVIADNADAGDTSARHIYRIEAGSGNSLGNGENLRNITITTDNVDFTTVTGLSPGENNVNVAGSGDINIFVGGSAVEDGNDGTVLDIAVQNANGGTNNQLVIGSADGAGTDAEDLANVDYATTLNNGDIITVELGQANGMANPSSTDTVNVTVGDAGGAGTAANGAAGGSGQTGAIDDLSMNLNGDAPITVFNSDDTIDSNHSVFASAASAIDSTDETIAIEGSVDNTDPTGGNVFGTTTISDQDGLTIEGTGSDASITVDSNAAPIVDVDDNDGLTISDITFNGTNNAATLVDVGTGTSVGNASVTNNVFNQTTGEAVTLDLDEGDDDDPATNDINGNEFSDVSEGINLIVSDGGNLDTNDAVNVEDNTVRSFDGTNAFRLNGLPVDVLTFNVNDFDGGASGTNAIQIAGTNENVTITGGTVNDVTGDGVNVGATGGDGITISDTTFTNISTNSVDLQTVAGGSSEVVINGITVDDGSGSGVGVLINDGDADVTISDSSSINDTNVGVQATNTNSLVVSSTDITNTNSNGIDINNPGGLTNGIVVNGSTLIDNAGADGILVDLGNIAGTGNTVDVNNVEINASADAGVNLDHSGSGNNLADNAAVNISSSAITNNAGGFNITSTQGNTDARINARFNTFESNDIGVRVDDNNQYTPNITFNNFIDNGVGMNVLNINTGGGDQVNANYSYWGAPTGPANGGNTQDAFGDGDSVTLSSSSDATVYPFLTEETGSLISDSQQSGSQLIVLPDPERPIGNANDDNTALVGVANLNGSVGADNPDLFAEGADSPPTAAQSFSGTLSPSNIAQFEVNLSSPDTIDVQGVADGASSNTVQQTYTGQSDSITFSANRSVVSTDVGAEITAQAIDSSGNPVERQGLNVRFAEDSGFSDAGVTLSSSDGNTSNNGTATAIVQNDGSLTPGQEFTVLANIDGNVERANFSTAAGEIDPGASTLRLNGSGSDFGNLQVDSTVDVSAEITDANNNPLEGRTVEFSSNGTVEFGSDSVDTNSDGFANTTATVDTETQGVVAINATAGNFNTTSTSSAQRNITTIAGDATQLGFASDTRSMAPSASLNPTVQVQDEFGNFNDTANVNNGISVTSGDTNIISVSGVDDLSSNSDQFTLSAESGGEATITVSSDDSDISGVNDTFVVSDPAAIDLSVAHNVATVSANNSNANTQNQALVTAQFTDSDGSALGVANENISFGLSGSSAELNQSDVTTKSTDSDGNVTILVNGTDTTGTSTIVATSENFTSIDRGETTVTTTGPASGISLSPENDTIAQNDEINVTAEFVDDEGRNVPRLTDVSLSAGDGNVTTGTTATAPNDDGAVVSTFTYNSSGANGSVTITATGGGLFGDATITVEEAQQQEPSVSVTFSDQTVPNGTEEITIDSANFTRADGSAGDYVAVVHVVNDDEFDGGVDNSISAPVGASGNLSNGAENITVDLNSSAAFEDGDALDSITENVTLRAMLHTTDDDSAFGTRLGNAIDGIEPGDETDDANITISKDIFAEPAPGTGAESPPQDPDGDGKFEDVNGDNQVNFDDVIDLAFAQPEADNLTNQQRDALDIDDDGDVDFDDVIELAFQL